MGRNFTLVAVLAFSWFVGAIGFWAVGLSDDGGITEVREWISGSDSDLMVLFIQGINSTSCTNKDRPAADFVEHVEWLRESLKRDVEGVDDDSFLYYTYTSREISAARPPVCSAEPCTETGCPSYDKHDACWSLDDEYILRGGRKGNVIGQAQRLATYIDKNVKDGAKLTIVAHSQGGVLAAYTVKMLDSWRPEIKLGPVRAVVTLDSPLGGISKSEAGALRYLGRACGDDRREDSHRDMEVDTQVIQEASSGEPPATTKLYTIDADPGCFVKIFSLCPHVSKSESSWQEAHLSAEADTHSDIWQGVFKGSAEQTRVESFIACAVGQFPENCEEYADDSSE